MLRKLPIGRTAYVKRETIWCSWFGVPLLAVRRPCQSGLRKRVTFQPTLGTSPLTRHTSRVIDTDAKLAAFLPVVHAAAWIAVDTEADSLHAYPEKICLIQISTVAGDRLVDPLAG